MDREVSLRGLLRGPRQHDWHGLDDLEGHLGGFANLSWSRARHPFANEAVQGLDAPGLRALDDGDHRFKVQPLLDHAVHYFLRPVDLVPEMTMGLAGLLDDTYLVLKVLENLQKGPDPLLDWDLEHPMDFIATLVGPDLQRQLDSISVNALLEISDNVSRLWQNMARDA